MSPPTTAREALIAEAIGDVARLIDRVEVLVPALNESGRALLDADIAVREQLAGFERRIRILAENAQSQTIRHLAARTDEAARRSIDLQSKAMAEAARVAFGAEIGPTMHRHCSMLQPLLEQRTGGRPWQRWLAHAATAVVSSALTWALMIRWGPC